MSTLASKPEAPALVDGNEEIWVVHPTLGNSRRKLSTIVAFVNGYSGSARGFFGASAIPQPAHADQVAWSTTFGPPVTLTVGAPVDMTPATDTSPYGFATAQQADDLVARVNQLIADVTAINALLSQIRTDMGNGNKLVSAIRTALVNLGLIKGSA